MTTFLTARPKFFPGRLSTLVEQSADGLLLDGALPRSFCSVKLYLTIVFSLLMQLPLRSVPPDLIHEHFPAPVGPIQAPFRVYLTSRWRPFSASRRYYQSCV